MHFDLSEFKMDKQPDEYFPRRRVDKARVQKRPMASLNDSESSRLATKRARQAEPAPRTGDAKAINIRAITDRDEYPFNVEIKDLIAFARLPLSQRRAAMWSDKCAECKSDLDDSLELPLVLCSLCRRFRYCTVVCRGKHMGHSISGCFASSENRISDKHRVRHVLTGDASALEKTLAQGTIDMAYSNHNPKLRYQEEMLLLELACYTGDPHTISVVVRATAQKPFSCTPPRPLCASIALQGHHIRGLLALFSYEFLDEEVRTVEQIPTQCGANILAQIVSATRGRSFPGSAPVIPEGREPKGIAQDFYFQRLEVMHLLWELLKQGMPFYMPPATSLMDDLLDLWFHYRDTIPIAEATISHLLKWDRRPGKKLIATHFESLCEHGSATLMWDFLKEGFVFPYQCDNLVATKPYMTPDKWAVLAYQLGEHGWHEEDAGQPVVEHRELDRSALQMAWDAYRVTGSTKHEDRLASIQWLASQGCELDTNALNLWAKIPLKCNALDREMAIRNAFANRTLGQLRIKPDWIAGMDAVQSGFNAFGVAATLVLLEKTPFPKAVITQVLLPFLVQKQTYELLSTIRFLVDDLRRQTQEDEDKHAAERAAAAPALAPFVFFI
jgi:hypothetical protein